MCGWITLAGDCAFGGTSLVVGTSALAGSALASAAEECTAKVRDVRLFAWKWPGDLAQFSALARMGRPRPAACLNLRSESLQEHFSRRRAGLGYTGERPNCAHSAC